MAVVEEGIDFSRILISGLLRRLRLKLGVSVSASGMISLPSRTPFCVANVSAAVTVAASAAAPLQLQ